MLLICDTGEDSWKFLELQENQTMNPKVNKPWIFMEARGSPKLMSVESVIPSSHLILCRPLLLLPPVPPSIRVFSSESIFTWGGQSTGVSASASVLLIWAHLCMMVSLIFLKRSLVFPILFFSSVSLHWSLKKAERRRIDAFELWWWRLLRVHGLQGDPTNPF